MRTYTIIISEDQRLALLELVRHYPDEPGEPLEYWFEMLEQLPAVEEADPGVLHGFCY